jgi:nucleoside-diphosphate-sugar epimerase
VNIKGTKLLLNAAEKKNVKRFVFASSAAIYGADPRLPKLETMDGVPISPYGNSKSIGEMAVIGSHERTKLKGVALRYFNVYGPRQNPNSDYSGVITKFISKMLRDERPTIYGDGEQTRDFVFVEDVVQANLLALKKKDALGQVFNIGTGHQTTLNELVAVLNELLGTELKPIHELARQGDIRYSYASIDKAEKLLDYKPKTTLKNGLKKTIEWFRKVRQEQV